MLIKLYTDKLYTVDKPTDYGVMWLTEGILIGFCIKVFILNDIVTSCVFL